MRTLTIVLLLVGVGIVTGVAPYMESLYGRTKPQMRDLSAGRIYPLNVHGTVVYLTKGEHLLETWLFPCGFVVALAGGVLFQRQFPGHGRDA